MIEVQTEIRAGHKNGRRVTTRAIDRHPNHCPICLHAIGVIDTEQRWLFEDCRLEIVFRCPRPDCERYFVARYDPIEPKSSQYAFSEAVPLTVSQTDYSPVIESISPDFVAIDRQAEEADLRGLTLICGPGYRKALEFLIKDYVITLHRDKADEIKQMALGQCISDFVQNEKVKEVARRAAWLGNDEVHYLRKWSEKDVTDLKRLIELTVLWIEMENLTDKAITDMPRAR